MRGIVIVALAVSTVACAGATSPVSPSLSDNAAATMTLEAEAASGTGILLNRSKASGGRTVHLAPGERREWSLPNAVLTGVYAMSITYSNGGFANRETLTVLVDHTTASVLDTRDTGEDDEGGWNHFVTDAIGTASFDRMRRVLSVASDGGDGCIEIDKITLERVSSP